MQTNEVADLTAALTALKRGEVIVFPTETLYGLGADALNFTAVEKVFQLKGRDPDNPFPVLSRRPGDARLPGRSNISARGIIDRELLAGAADTGAARARRHSAARWSIARGGIGVRLSSQPIATELVRLLGRPLTATSANPSGQPGARTVVQAKNYFAGKIDIYLDGGELNSPTGSTVAAVMRDRLRIIRAGEVSREALEAVVGKGVIET